MPVEYFFEGLEGDAPAVSPDDVMVKTETLKLVKAYGRISDPAVREALVRMTKALAKRAGTR